MMIDLNDIPSLDELVERKRMLGLTCSDIFFGCQLNGNKITLPTIYMAMNKRQEKRRGSLMTRLTIQNGMIRYCQEQQKKGDIHHG